MQTNEVTGILQCLLIFKRQSLCYPSYLQTHLALGHPLSDWNYRSIRLDILFNIYQI